ncbi:unnamed protein product [Spirodela intermedia]|uniref:Senescence domain-containing protein n=1 Tax=Spirodela intermedia TaxID=51605 RepID=A0A7I8JTK7_SPIIN|nr:unnamed protein product [Spirodela intermedia]CAA6673506.1 unnamed protein product [Spirodela intermedia]
MDSSRQNPYGNYQSLYPEVVQTNPELHSPFVSSAADSTRGGALYPSLDHPTSVPTASSGSSSLYPSIEMKDLVDNLFPDAEEVGSAPGNPNLGHPPVEETLVRVPGAILHLIDRQRTGDNVIAVLARVGDVVQWPLAKDEAAVRLDHSRYFFSLRVPEGSSDVGGDDARHSGDGSDNLLNYGLTFASKGQEALLEALDGILAYYTNFSLQKVETKAEVLDESVPKETSPAEVATSGPKREKIEKLSAAYWTTLAPNVEDYSGSLPRAIARGSGYLIRGILWCGDVTVDRLNRGNDVLKNRMSPNSNRRRSRVTKMSEKVANGVLSGALKVSGFVTSSAVNSRAGRKFFSLLPGRLFSLLLMASVPRVGDAVEAAGKNVLSTSSTVTTEVISHKYGEGAAKLTNEGLHATGHAMGTAWAVFKLRKALNPKNSIKPTSIVKSAVKAAASKSKAKQ